MGHIGPREHVLIGVGPAMSLVVAKLGPVGVDQEGVRVSQATAPARCLDTMPTGEGRGRNGDAKGKASQTTCRGSAHDRRGMKGGDDGFAAAKAGPLDDQRRGGWASDLG